jgi:hypothetical protein
MRYGELFFSKRAILGNENFLLLIRNRCEETILQGRYKVASLIADHVTPTAPRRPNNPLPFIELPFRHGN